MRFPNAANGVKKLFTAEILALIGGVLLLAAGVAALIMLASGKVMEQSSLEGIGAAVLASGGAAVFFLLAAVVLFVISFIINIIGLAKASNDDGSFKIALFAVIVGLAVTLLSTLFSSNSVVSSLLTSLESVAELVTTIYVIQGIRNLAVRLNNGQMDEKGNTLFKVMLAVILLGFISRIIITIFGGQIWASIPAAVLQMVSGVLSIVQYFLYLSYLGKAKKMLNQS